MGINDWPMPTNDNSKKSDEEAKEQNFINFEQITAEKKDLLNLKKEELLLILNEVKEKPKNINIDSEIEEKVKDFLKNEYKENISLTKDRRGESLDFNSYETSLSSLLSALADKNPDNQPLGVDIVELAHKFNLPTVMFTSAGHTRGEFAYTLVNEYLASNGLSDGIIDKDLIYRSKNFNVGGNRQMGYLRNTSELSEKEKLVSQAYETTKEILKNEVANDSIDRINKMIINVYDEKVAYNLNGELVDKDYAGPIITLQGLWTPESVESWENALETIKERAGAKDHYTILLVEDSPINIDCAEISLAKELKTGSITIINAPDYESAEKILNEKHAEIDGVITDLYFPDKLESSDKSHGEAVYKKIVAQFLKNPNQADNILNEVKQEYEKHY